MPSPRVKSEECTGSERAKKHILPVPASGVSPKTTLVGGGDVIVTEPPFFFFFHFRCARCIIMNDDFDQPPFHDNVDCLILLVTNL